MSKLEKAIKRLLSQPKDFTWNELVSLTQHFGIELRSGIGSAHKLTNPRTGQIFSIHGPHPSNILKPYQVREAVKFMRQEGFL